MVELLVQMSDYQLPPEFHGITSKQPVFFRYPNYNKEGAFMGSNSKMFVLCTNLKWNYFELQLQVYKLLFLLVLLVLVLVLLLPSIGTTAHCGLWPVEQCPSTFSYLPQTLSIFSLPTLEDLFLLPLSIFSWVFPFFSSLPVLE